MKTINKIDEENLETDWCMHIALFFLLSAFLLITVVSASLPDCEFNLPTAKSGTCVNIINSCANCSFINISTVYLPPSSGEILSLDAEMTKNGVSYNYSFCNTTIIGTYVVTSFGDPNGELVISNTCFETTRSGDNLSGVQGAILFIPLIVFCFLTVYFGGNFFVSNTIIAKAMYFDLAYFIGLLPVTFLMYSIVNSYLPTFTVVSNVLYYAMYIVIILCPIVFFVSSGYMVYDRVMATQDKKLIERGHSESDIANRARRRR